VIEVDHAAHEVHVVADDEAAAARLELRMAEAAAEASDYRLEVREDEPPELHVARVRELIERIYDGELYQANLARRLRVELEPCAPLQVLAAAEALTTAFPTAFGAVLRTSSGWVILDEPRAAARRGAQR
jgi:anthranilate/para-aminobenzoate synthase component I